jgi:hypothetical protein
VVDERFHSTISERFDVESNRHSDPIRRLRSRVCWIVTIVSVLAGMLVWSGGDSRLYESRPVASPHQLFEQKCELCHQQSFHLLRRTLGAAGSAFQHACKKCHAQDGADHHPTQINAAMVDDCTACHKEHQDHSDLIAVTDSHCIRCHQDLSTSLATDRAAFTSGISSIENHPEIAIMRGLDGVGEVHGAHKVADWLDGQWRDNGKLVFNHAVHMDPLGVLVPTDHSEYGKKDRDGPLRTTLDCSSCHQPDGQGVYMQPISFEQHCRSCHQLQFSTQLASLEKSLADGDPLPHATPEIIRGVLRDRLMEYIERSSGLLSPGGEEETPRNPAKPPRDATAADKWEWVEERLPRIESLLFDDGAMAGEGDLKYGCQRCHQTQQINEGGRVKWGVVDPQIPQRWLAHTRFPHNRHEMVRCLECHHGMQDGTSPQDTGFVMLSTRSEDILMPSINVCRSCHQGAAASKTGMVSGRCTDCHRYHGTATIDSATADSLRDYLESAADRQGRSE